MGILISDCNLLDLPSEVLSVIIQFVEADDSRCMLQAVCKRLRDLVYMNKTVCILNINVLSDRFHPLCRMPNVQKLEIHSGV